MLFEKSKLLLVCCLAFYVPLHAGSTRMNVYALILKLYSLCFIQDEAALSLRDVGSNESYRWNNLPSNSFDYDDIPEDAFHMVQSNATGNRQIYEELKR